MHESNDIDRPAVPAWFSAAVQQPGQSVFYRTRGQRRHLLTWNWQDVEKPAVLLVHGYLAHANWWAPIAPQLTDRWRVAAMDLSGMGDSEAGPDVSPLSLALDVLDALDFLKLPSATVVGHSYGGSRALRASGLRRGAIHHLVMLDSYVNAPGEMPRQGPPLGESKLYANPQEALARYRFRPSDVEIPVFVKRHVVETGLRRHADGWRWKFTSGLRVSEEILGVEMLRGTHARRVDYVRGGSSSLVSEQCARWIVAEMAHKTDARLHEFPGGHHHFLLQDPQQTARLLRGLLSR
ncbi:alpha/beta fold hydrolase [Hydrogenophaga sp. BPS33]|uniref:alpha/beta fold hydrolase n=1 Tax=Hydrogenophaga sp. BPS33 TaxID=2651974 RepID=UPI00135C34F6|nr:alpha/beta hydrolase [Hydrogenophaga sp. BPS33]